MKMTYLKTWKFPDGILQKRLIWNAESSADKVIDSGEALKEKEKLDTKKIDELASRIKSLKLNNGLPIDIGTKGQPSGAVELRATLKKQLDAQNISKDLKVNNVDLYLMNGLLESVGKADAKLSVLGQGEMNDLTKWMKEKGITKFTIDNGYWSFFDKDGKAISADYRLDEKPKSDEKPKDSEKQKVALDKMKKMIGKDGTVTAENQKEMAKLIRENDLKDKISVPKKYNGDLQKFLADLDQGKVSKSDFAEVKPTEKSEVKPVTVKLDKVAVTSEVGKKKNQEETEGKTAEAERLKPENLAKVTSKEDILLGKDTLEIVLGKLEAGLKNDKGVPAIKADEMRPMLLEYINAAQVEGANDEEKFKNFVARLDAKGYKTISIEKGKFIFTKKVESKNDKGDTKIDVTKTSNPMDFAKLVNGKMDKNNSIYAHSVLRDKSDAENKEKGTEADKKKTAESTDKTDKVDPRISKIEADMKPILEKPADARYLPAYEAMLSFKGAPVEFKIPFNDSPLSCVMTRNEKGTYIIKYGKKPNADMTYQPSTGSKNPLEEAIKFFGNKMNDGEMLRKIQSFNVRAKENFTKYQIPIDNGPTEVKGGKVEYELGWKTGALERDPHIFIETLPHGEIRVQVKKADIGFSTDKNAKNDEYTFVAGGFHDMIRVLNSLQKWHENPNKANPEEQKDEADRRFLQRGAADLSNEILPQNKVGKLLKVESVGGTINLRQGTILYFDWMEKLTPPQYLNVAKVGDRYRVSINPPEKLLGNVNGPISEGGKFNEVMKLVALQRSELVEVGGEKMIKDKFSSLIEDYNKQIGGKKRGVSVRDNVKVVGYSGTDGGAQYITLSMGEGMAPQRFDFRVAKVTVDGRDKIISPGIEEAVKQGYLIRTPADIGQTETTDAKPAESKDKPTVAANALRADGESPVISPDAQKAIDGVLKQIKNPKEKQKLADALKVYLTGFTSVEEDLLNRAISAGLRNYLRIDKATVDKKVGPDASVKNKMDYMISLVNNPNLLKESDKKPLDEMDKYYETKYKDYPRTLNVVKSFIGNLRVAQENSSGETLNGKTVEQDYRMQMDAAIHGKLSELKAKKPALKAVGIDAALSEYVGKSFKVPATEFYKSWYKNFTEEKAAKEKSEATAKEKKDFEDQKASPNGMPFADFEKQPMLGLGPDAWAMLKETAAVKPENIFLSKLPKNTPANEDRLCFNIKAGKDGDLRPYTVVFSRERGLAVARIAPGWNNTEVFADMNYASSKIKKSETSTNKGLDSEVVGLRPDPIASLVEGAHAIMVGLDTGAPMIQGVDENGKIKLGVKMKRVPATIPSLDAPKDKTDTAKPVEAPVVDPKPIVDVPVIPPVKPGLGSKLPSAVA